MTLQVYKGPWNRVRTSILDRDGRICQIRGPKCVRIANTVDHIVPVLSGGAWYDPANLRASCGPCNYGRSTGSQRWQTNVTRITLVTGDDQSKLTKYVKLHRQGADLVVDRGLILKTVNDEQSATLLYERMVSQIRQGKVKNQRCWITSTNPQARGTLPHHVLVKIGGVVQGGAKPAFTESNATHATHATPHTTEHAQARAW